MRNLLIGTVAMCALLVGTTAQADVLYSQAFDGSGNAFSSQNDTSSGGLGKFAQVYDDFTLGTNAIITDLHWTGEYFNPPSQGTIASWEVDFYGDSAGQPGGLLSTQTISGTGNETFLGTFGGFPDYTYDLNLTPLAVNSFTRYWVSVVPNMAFPPQWGWSTATGGNGISYQDFFGTRSPVAADMAYSLTGQAVPEPASMSLLALGLGAFALRRRIKK